MSSDDKLQETKKLLDREASTPVQILPNGEIVPAGDDVETGNFQPTTLGEDLGGEYLQGSHG